MELLDGTTFGVPIFHVYGHGAACQVGMIALNKGEHVHVHTRHGVGDMPYHCFSLPTPLEF